MRLAVLSHKECWPSARSPSGFATDGGFALQMAAIAELFDATDICVPVEASGNHDGEVAIRGPEVAVAPLPVLRGHGWRRKARFVPWLIRAGLTIDRVIRSADAVHAPIPGDVGTAGMILATLRRKRLFVRHCGNWHNQRTWAEWFWRWFMEWRAESGDVMVATGAEGTGPSPNHPDIQWIFSSSLRADELERLKREPRVPPDGRFQLVIVCRQETAKGTGVVLEAFRLFLRSFPDARLHVVGDGPDLSGFRKIACGLGVDRSVKFHGKTDHDGVLDILGECHLFAYPTRASEGFPKVVLEAMACGLPVVATPVSAIPQMLSSGAGILIPDPDPEQLGSALIELASSPDRLAEMSREAQETAERYTLDAWRDRIGELLDGWGPLKRGPQHTSDGVDPRNLRNEAR